MHTQRVEGRTNEEDADVCMLFHDAAGANVKAASRKLVSTVGRADSAPVTYSSNGKPIKTAPQCPRGRSNRSRLGENDSSRRRSPDPVAGSVSGGSSSKKTDFCLDKLLGTCGAFGCSAEGVGFTPRFRLRPANEVGSRTWLSMPTSVEKKKGPPA